MAFNQSCYGIRAKEGINSTFLYYLLKSNISKLKMITHGSVFDTITRDSFDNVYVSIPDTYTQNKIAVHIPCHWLSYIVEIVSIFVEYGTIKGIYLWIEKRPFFNAGQFKTIIACKHMTMPMVQILPTWGWLRHFFSFLMNTVYFIWRIVGLEPNYRYGILLTI